MSEETGFRPAKFDKVELVEFAMQTSRRRAGLLALHLGRFLERKLRKEL